MSKESGVYYNNPLLYIFIVFILASFTYEIYYYNKLAAILIAASLFFLITFNTERYLKIFLLIILIIALMNNVFYYNYTPKANEEIRVVSLKYNRGNWRDKGEKSKYIYRSFRRNCRVLKFTQKEILIEILIFLKV